MPSPLELGPNTFGDLTADGGGRSNTPARVLRDGTPSEHAPTVSTVATVQL